MSASSFISRFGGNSATGQSGMGSLDRALAAGLSASEINRMGVRFGPAATAKLAQLNNTFIGQYGGNHSTNQTGLGSLNRALGSGLTIKDIARMRDSQGFSFGPAAQAEFDARTPRPGSFIDQYGGDAKANASGLASVNRAVAAGSTLSDIEQRGIAEGVAWGPAAQSAFASNNANIKLIGDLEKKLADQDAASQLQISGLNDKLTQQTKANETLLTKFGDLESTYTQSVNALRSDLNKAQNSYNKTTDLGISSSLGGFNPSSQGTPLSVRQMGTSRFNRKNRDKLQNQLKISNINI